MLVSRWFLFFFSLIPYEQKIKMSMFLPLMFMLVLYRVAVTLFSQDAPRAMSWKWNQVWANAAGFVARNIAHSNAVSLEIYLSHKANFLRFLSQKQILSTWTHPKLLFQYSGIVVLKCFSHPPFLIRAFVPLCCSQRWSSQVLSCSACNRSILTNASETDCSADCKQSDSRWS